MMNLAQHPCSSSRVLRCTYLFETEYCYMTQWLELKSQALYPLQQSWEASCFQGHVCGGSYSHVSSQGPASALFCVSYQRLRYISSPTRGGTRTSTPTIPKQHYKYLLLCSFSHQLPGKARTHLFSFPLTLFINNTAQFSRYKVFS